MKPRKHGSRNLVRNAKSSRPYGKNNPFSTPTFFPMLPPFLKRRERTSGSDPESNKWIWYVFGLMTLLWLLYSWFFDK
jgi:hypothetical protein